MSGGRLAVPGAPGLDLFVRSATTDYRRRFLGNPLILGQRGRAAAFVRRRS
jgi:hypothetical protein